MHIKKNKYLCLYILIAFVVLSCKKDLAKENIIYKKEIAINSLKKNDSTVYDVQEAMKANSLLGLSVAVIENYEIAWTETWGIKEVGLKEKIDVKTSFSAASIAKPITATLIAILEEKGLIDLKAPVSNYLKRWQLPESDFLKDTDVTLEHLLSHTAGTSQGGFEDFYEGDTIPTIVQSLKGEIPGYDKEIEFLTLPGTTWRYSGGGYVIAQLAIEDHLNKPLSDLANEYLFKPLGLKNTTMKQPNEDPFLSNIAKAHNEKGEKIRTGIPITPQIAPSGLWSTPSDMAMFLIEIQNALRGTNNKVISNQVAKRATKIVTSKVMGGWSMGWERRFGYGNYEWFSHGGANTGVGGYVYATMKDGNGMVFFGNGANRNRSPVIDQFAKSIIKAHKWYLLLDRSLEKPITEEIVKQIVGKYKDVNFGNIKKIYHKNNKLYFPYFGKDRELIHLGKNTFMLDEISSKLKFEINPGSQDVFAYWLRNGTNEKVVAYKK